MEKDDSSCHKLGHYIWIRWLEDFIHVIICWSLRHLWKVTQIKQHSTTLIENYTLLSVALVLKDGRKIFAKQILITFTVLVAGYFNITSILFAIGLKIEISVRKTKVFNKRSLRDLNMEYWKD